MSTESFYDRLWRYEWADMELYNPTAQHLKKIIKKHIAQLPDVSSLLDAGCGAGYNVKDISNSFPAIFIVGTDLTESIIELASLYNNSNDKVSFTTLDLSKNYLNKKFDLVLCNQVLEHIEDDIAALINLKKMSSKYVLITVPSGKFNTTSELVGHYRHYSIDELLRKVKIAGLDVISVYSWGFPFHSFYKYLLGLLSIEMQKKIGMGSYGPKKIFFSKLIYFLFKFNILKYGSNIILLAKV